MYILSLCLLTAGGIEYLAEGAAALAAGRFPEAVELLQEARRRGPYRYRDHVRLYEHLGLACALADYSEGGLAAFDMLLTLDPSYELDPTIFPTVLTLFERARRVNERQPLPLLRVHWPAAIDGHQPVPLTVEVLADPKLMLRRAVIFARVDGQTGYRKLLVDLPDIGDSEHVVLPPPKAVNPQATVVHVYVTAQDRAGNEVLLWGDERHPHVLSLQDTPPPSWLARWCRWCVD